jgi:preprotein translocase subunit Sec63
MTVGTIAAADTKPLTPAAVTTAAIFTDYYKILGLERSVEADGIKKAYRKLALKVRYKRL